MAFFDKLNQVAKNLGDKTSDAIEITKLNTKIASENMAAAELMKKIGEFVYQQYADGKEVANEVLDFCAAAKAHYDAVESAQTEIEKIKAEDQEAQPQAEKENRCPSCSAVNLPGTKFCQNCGMKLEEKNPESVQAARCPSCSALVSTGTKFCPECGMKMEG